MNLFINYYLAPKIMHTIIQTFLTSTHLSAQKHIYTTLYLVAPILIFKLIYRNHLPRIQGIGKLAQMSEIFFNQEYTS